VLADDERATALTDAGQRGLSPLFWTHVAPYDELKLDMNSRLQPGTPTPAGSPELARQSACRRAHQAPGFG
jgi:hypothetical protein